MNFPFKAIISNPHDSYGYPSNDNKYITPYQDRVVTIVDKINNFLLTNLYIKEFKEEVNDYIFHGFLLLTEENIKRVEE